MPTVRRPTPLPLWVAVATAGLFWRPFGPESTSPASLAVGPSLPEVDPQATVAGDCVATDDDARRSGRKHRDPGPGVVRDRVLFAGGDAADRCAGRRAGPDDQDPVGRVRDRGEAVGAGADPVRLHDHARRILDADPVTRLPGHDVAFSGCTDRGVRRRKQLDPVRRGRIVQRGRAGGVRADPVAPDVCAGRALNIDGCDDVVEDRRRGCLVDPQRSTSQRRRARGVDADPVVAHDRSACRCAEDGQAASDHVPSAAVAPPIVLPPPPCTVTDPNAGGVIVAVPPASVPTKLALSVFPGWVIRHVPVGEPCDHEARDHVPGAADHEAVVPGACARAVHNHLPARVAGLGRPVDRQLVRQRGQRRVEADRRVAERQVEEDLVRTGQGVRRVDRLPQRARNRIADAVRVISGLVHGEHGAEPGRSDEHGKAGPDDERGDPRPAARAPQAWTRDPPHDVRPD